MSDYIDTLPVDELPLNSEESHFMDLILKESKTDQIHRLLSDSKQVFVAGILFFILNSEIVTSILKGTISYTQESSLSLLVFKTVLFIILLYCVQNFHYSKS